MKIIAAFSDLKELKMLAENGADEVYCGVLKSSQMPTMNHRPNSLSMNLKDLKELSRAIKLAHEYNKKIGLVVNEVGCIYTNLANFISHLKKLDQMGIDNFVVSDMVLIEAIKKSGGLNASLTLSSVLPCLNSRTAKYFQKRGISRFVVPQHLYPKELERLKQNSWLDSEVFFYGTNYCRNIDGYCFYTYNKQLWKGEIPLDACDKICRAEHICHGKRSAWRGKRIFNNPVHQDIFGAVYDYYMAGAGFLKLGNREACTKTKKKTIKMANHMKEKLKTTKSRSGFVNSCRLKALKLMY